MPRERQRGGFSVPICGLSPLRAVLRLDTVKQPCANAHSLGNIGLIGAIALLALVANGLLNNRIP